MTAENRTGLERIIEYRDRLRGIIGEIEQAPPEMQNPVELGLFRLVLESNEKVIDCVQNGKPFVSSWYGNAPEIYTAMGIHFINPVFDILLHMNITQLYDLEQADKISLPDDICSLIRLASYAVQERLLPKPTAIIAMLQPCDGELMLHQSYMNSEHWGDVPIYALDPVYGSSDEDFRYFAGELKRMISFLEQISGYKYDVNKLREVVEETNRQYETWAEYNELMRAIPAPGGSFQGSLVGWPLTQHIPSGQPRATELLRMMVAAAEQKVKEGKGFLENEKIRILWPDLSPQWAEELGGWLAEEWGANVIMDFQGYTPYIPIDTSTEETMLFGLARRALSEVPMIRQARGTVEVMVEDMTRIIKDYSIDCVIFPGHMGHKDQSASISFMKELCRDLNVPLLSLTTSLFDERYTPVSEVKKQISQFFNAYDLGNK